MTERTVTTQSLRTDDYDSISITSTQESEADEERSYVVDRILAEQDDGEGNKYYLIRWDGYGLLASTWEPAENIEGRATLDDWKEEKMRVSRGLSDDFDVTAFEEEVERLRLAKEERRERRKAKRDRLGLATSLSSENKGNVSLPVLRNEDMQRDVETDLVEKDDEEVIKRQGRKPGSKSKPAISKNASTTDEGAVKSTISTRVKRRTINLPTKDHITDTSEDSMVEELKQDTTKATARAKRPRAIINRQADDVGVILYASTNWKYLLNSSPGFRFCL